VPRPDPVKLSGGCQCGAVRFELEGQPYWVAHCHCSLCRKQTSAPYATWISLPADAVTFTKGEPKIWEDKPDRQRGFCSECGTQVLGKTPKYAGEVHFLVGALDEPNAVTPQVHSFFADALDWVHPGDGLRRFATTSKEGPPLA